jgi:hypothetical protein
LFLGREFMQFACRRHDTRGMGTDACGRTSTGGPLLTRADGTKLPTSALKA